MENVATIKELIRPDKGYHELFKVTGKTLTDKSGLNEYKPHEVEIRNYFKLNGNAKPEDNAIAYLLETEDGKKGVLVYKYDVFTDSRVFNFIQAIVYFQQRIKS
jgi:hypothetical protein